MFPIEHALNYSAPVCPKKLSKRRALAAGGLDYKEKSRISLEIRPLWKAVRVSGSLSDYALRRMATTMMRADIPKSTQVFGSGIDAVIF